MKTPEGANETNFRQMIRKWVRLEYACSSEVLKQKNRHKEWSAEELYELVAKVLAGKSIKSVAFSVAIDDGMLSSVLTNTKQRGKNHPTRVGTSVLYTLVRVRKKNHPHACGDKFSCSRFCSELRGSSPRIWGQEKATMQKAVCRRIIPTHMGTRTDLNTARAKFRDHPHAYGDKCHISLRNQQYPGSSPRIWGQVT